MLQGKKETVTVKDKDGNEVILDINFPSGKQLQDAHILYSSVWNKAANGGAMVKEQLEQFLKEKGIWGPEQEQQKLAYIKEIGDLHAALKKGGMSKKAGRDIALKIKDIQDELRQLLEKRNSFDSVSAESIAENARCDYLVSVCVVYNLTGQPYYKDYDDYQIRKAEEPGFEIASKVADMLYSNYNENFEKNLIENKFLQRFNFMDDKFRLIDEKGRLITRDGKLIDEEGYYINEEGKRVDINGNLILDDFGEFYDD